MLFIKLTRYIGNNSRKDSVSYSPNAAKLLLQAHILRLTSMTHTSCRDCNQYNLCTKGRSHCSQTIRVRVWVRHWIYSIYRLYYYNSIQMHLTQQQWYIIIFKFVWHWQQYTKPSGNVPGLWMLLCEFNPCIVLGFFVASISCVVRR